MRFADLAAGGRAVAALLPADLLEGSVLVGVPPEDWSWGPQSPRRSASRSPRSS